MRLEFPTMGEPNSLSRGASLESNKSVEYVLDEDGEQYQASYPMSKSARRGSISSNRKRNPLFRYQSMSMYPETAFNVVSI